MDLDVLLLSRRALLTTAGAAFLADWLRAGQHEHASTADPLRDYQPSFFDPNDFEALQAFTEILIPTDETPGAREARCAHYIDFLLHSSDEFPQVQASWRKAMRSLEEAGFHHGSPSERLALVTQWSQGNVAYRLIRQQTIFAYYTSRVGTLQELDYKGNTYNVTFPGCRHPEHQTV